MKQERTTVPLPEKPATLAANRRELAYGDRRSEMTAIAGRASAPLTPLSGSSPQKNSEWYVSDRSSTPPRGTMRSRTRKNKKERGSFHNRLHGFELRPLFSLSPFLA